jgi:hypothetical protein
MANQRCRALDKAAVAALIGPSKTCIQITGPQSMERFPCSLESSGKRESDVPHPRLIGWHSIYRAPLAWSSFLTLARFGILFILG